MFATEDLSALRPDEKDAILDALLGMAWSDAEAQPEEVALLRRLVPPLGGGDVEKLLAEYRPDAERVGRKIARSDLGPPGRRILLKALAAVAAAAGGVVETERTFYRQILVAFGVPEVQRARLEEQAREWIQQQA